MTKTYTEKVLEEFKEKFMTSPNMSDNEMHNIATFGEIKSFISTALTTHEEAVRAEERKRLRQNIGLLRQWLNERPKGSPLLENEDIISWLNLD